MRSQNARLIDYLATGKSITPIEALNKWGVFRLSGRILELRQAGHRIDTTMIKRNGKRFAAYALKVAK